MAWNKCEVCGKKVNGWDDFKRHKTTHPEYEVIGLEGGLRSNRLELQGLQQLLIDYAEYRQALAMGLPAAARKMVEAKVNAWPFHGTIEQVERDLELTQQRITKIETALRERGINHAND